MVAMTEGESPNSKKESSGRDSEANKALAELRGRGLESPKSFVSSKQHDYEKLIFRVRKMVAEFLPSGATVLVVSKGDGELLRLQGKKAWHFPCTEAGDYPSHYPADSAAAIDHLEQLRAKGAGYILFPATAFWWLDFYADFRRHLDSHYSLVARDETTCLVFDLRKEKAEFSNEKQPDTFAIQSDQRAELTRSFPSHGSHSKAQNDLLEESRQDPDNLRLLVELAKVEHILGHQRADERYAAKARALAPDDYDVNFELAKLAWQRGQMDEVEQRLAKLVELYPSDVAVFAELIRFYCARVENKMAAASEKPLLSRFLTHLADPDKVRRLPPDVHLLIAESLAEIGQTEPALASLDAALGALNFESEALQNFVLRLLRTIVTSKSAIPFDESNLAVFLTHIGNGFAAINERFKSESCYRLAIAANSSGWNSASWAAFFNLAFGEMSRGNPIRALDYLSKSSRRLGPEKTATIVWPEQEGIAWPHARFDLSMAFEELKPAGSAWPTITVITPSFNQVQYVEEALLSVLNQNYPALEYIVLDAESSDGTLDILKRYEPRLSRLIIEPDEGQTDAINKGLRLSTGDIILWLNSDDLLGPGALFNIALEFLKDKADIIYGFCCEHSERRFGVINLPAVTPATFNIECLGDIFNYWLKGHYFYQPEVAFSRHILEKVGGSLSKELHYAMDYEFWMRCAQAGGRLAVVHWPVGFFRKHDKQKTTSIDQTIIEQARVRDRFVLPEPSLKRKLEIKQRLSRAFSKPVPEVTVVSTRAAETFSTDTARELREKLVVEDGLRVTFRSEIESLKPGEQELIIVLMNLCKEHEALRKLREAGHEGLVIGWFWDNHQRVFENYRAAADLDICIPGHGFAASYLRSSQYLMESPVPPCVTEWTGDEAAALFEKYGLRERSNTLYEGFVWDRFSEKRNRLAEQLIAEGALSDFFDENRRDNYLSMSPEERFKEWTSHKVSICLPGSGDMLQRFFNTLLAGQIPIVPQEMPELEELMPPEAQRQLPIVRLRSYTVAAVSEAHDEAVSLFNQGGQAGVLSRHHLALKHTFSERIRTIIAALGRMANESQTQFQGAKYSQ